MKKIWSDPADLHGAPARDEFGPEVSAALADLRASHGIASPVDHEQADAQREQLHFALPGVNRRGFLQLTGAAAVLAMVSGCGDPHPDTLVPHAEQPDGATLGEGVWYSTVVRVGGAARPVMVKCYDGRPIKLDGNPDHPLVAGRSDARTQAVLLDLYDPDRGGIDPAQPGIFNDGPRRRDGEAFVPLPWADLDRTVGERLKAGRVLLVTGPVDGPARLAHLAAVTAACGGRLRHVAYHPWAQDSAVAARQAVLGERSAPRWQLAKARVVASSSIDCSGARTASTSAGRSGMALLLSGKKTRSMPVSGVKTFWISARTRSSMALSEMLARRSEYRLMRFSVVLNR